MSRAGDGAQPPSTWADAVLDGERPARDSIAPPFVPSLPPVTTSTSATPRPTRVTMPIEAPAPAWHAAPALPPFNGAVKPRTSDLVPPARLMERVEDEEVEVDLADNEGPDARLADAPPAPEPIPAQAAPSPEVRRPSLAPPEDAGRPPMGPLAPLQLTRSADGVESHPPFGEDLRGAAAALAMVEGDDVDFGDSTSFGDHTSFGGSLPASSREAHLLALREAQAAGLRDANAAAQALAQLTIPPPLRSPPPSAGTGPKPLAAIAITRVAPSALARAVTPPPMPPMPPPGAAALASLPASLPDTVPPPSPASTLPPTLAAPTPPPFALAPLAVPAALAPLSAPTPEPTPLEVPPLAHEDDLEALPEGDLDDVAEVDERADPSDVVDLETLDLAFQSVFSARPAPSSTGGDVTLISATTGDLVFPGAASTGDVALRTDKPLAAPPPLPRVQAPLARRREQLPPKGDVVLGIDLGTTYTCAAIVEAKHASVLASRWGSPTIPSVVAFLPDGRTLVGESALRYGNDPRRVIAGSKRIFGRAFHSPIVQEAKDHFAYEIVPGAGGDAAIEVDGKVIELEDVAAAILREVRESASLQIEGRVNRAVITCPAHFNERQRESIRLAGEMAGFHVERVLSEPTAAALHFGLGRGLQKRKVLVYDLGGGTFDVSLLEVDGDVFEVIGTGGDTFLGGIDFDSCIADLIVEAFLEKENIDARSDPVALARVLEFAERAKRELTDRASTIVQIDHLTVQPHAARAITVPIKRSRVEELWTPLVEHTASIVEKMLARVNIAPSEIHEVLLVGGQSRTPLVQKRMEQLFSRKLSRDVNPDEAIALGAAQLGENVVRAAGVTLIDVLPMSIGVGLPGGRYKRILERETKLPAERSYTLRSTRDDQTRFEVMLFQGEDESVDNDEPLGVVELNDLPKGPKGTVAVLVTLRVTSQQVLEIEARETKTGKGVRARLATKHTAESIRRKLGLPLTPNLDHLRAKRAKKRGAGVWGWLTGLFKRW